MQFFFLKVYINTVNYSQAQGNYIMELLEVSDYRYNHKTGMDVPRNNIFCNIVRMFTLLIYSGKFNIWTFL